ncbi:MAG: peptidylprolyl isomerase [bacterium]|nr:peptidylprolyl isomerase [bacterium]
MIKKNFLIITGLIIVVAVSLSIVSQKKEDKNPDNPPLSLGAESELNNPPNIIDKNMKDQTKKEVRIVKIDTNFGEIQFETYDTDAPKTVDNFMTLARKGFYDNLTFHRVIKGFMIQGGDPSGNGTGGPGYKFEDELNPAAESYKAGYKKGVVAMANAGPNTNGSQFFIMLEDYPLPNNYTIFGKVVKGQEVVDKIGLVKTGVSDKPLEAVVMKKVTVQ